MATAAVTQAQKQSAVQLTQSLFLVRNLLRISLFNISHARGLFPDEYFEEAPLAGLGMSVMKLKPVDKESRMLVDWMEKGAYDAISHGYLKTLSFIIATDEDGTNPLEEYRFFFNYEDGSMMMSSNKGTKKVSSLKVNANATAADVKQAVCKLIRNLVTLMQALDPVPAERFLLMRLSYHDHTPEDYEPPYFRSSTGQPEAHFPQGAFKAKLGGVSTPHHAVALRVKSLLVTDDDEDASDDEMVEAAEARPTPRKPSSVEAAVDGDDEQASDTTALSDDNDCAAADRVDNDQDESSRVANEISQRTSQDPKKRLMNDLAQLNSPEFDTVQFTEAADAASLPLGRYAQIAGFARTSSKPFTEASVVKQFPSIPADEVGRALQQMEERLDLVARVPNRRNAQKIYTAAKEAAVPFSASCPAEQGSHQEAVDGMTAALQATRVQASGGAGSTLQSTVAGKGAYVSRGRGHKESSQPGHNASQKHAASKSDDSITPKAPRSARKLRGTPAKRAKEMDDEDVVPDSQDTFDILAKPGNLTRKSSLVQLPIVQGWKRSKRSAA